MTVFVRVDSPLPRQYCPHCHVVVNTATSRHGEIPVAGHISLCVACGKVAQFNEALQMIPLTDEEAESLSDGREIMEEVRLFRRVNQGRLSRL